MSADAQEAIAEMGGRGDGLQPPLHDRVTVVRAPSLVISGPDGALSAGADGLYCGDRRLLSVLSLDVVGFETVTLGHWLSGASTAVFRSWVRGAGQQTDDPAVEIVVARSVTPGGFTDRLEVRNYGGKHLELELRVSAGTDLASMREVKSGQPTRLLAASGAEHGLRWTGSGGEALLRTDPAPAWADHAVGAIGHRLHLAAGASATVSVLVTGTPSVPALFSAPADDEPPWSVPQVDCGDSRLADLLARSLADLHALVLVDEAEIDAAEPDGAGPRQGQGAAPAAFLAAGAPWFLTLFGRDSLWAARFLLPLGTRLAGDTLTTLARRQGRATDARTGEEPGKIVHELRVETADGTQLASSLPACYYGTVDATALWVVLLCDAWRWGLPDEQVARLLDPLEAALCWLADAAGRAPSGFIRYRDLTNSGLVNQGWRDSGDSIRWADGRLAVPPIALAEVQAYAVEAATKAADVLDAFGRPGGDRWRGWAEQLRARFRERFWLSDAAGVRPGTALDGEDKVVDAVTSSLGHLLGTGLLDAAETRQVARYLSAPGDLDSGLGLRTLSPASVGFNPFGYHIGSIWPHDTLIAAQGLARSGYPGEAWSLLNGLLEAAGSFGFRLPELFSGHTAAGVAVPYPAACRPQAWAAAAGVGLLAVLAGVEADVPAGHLDVHPLATGLGPLSVRGLVAGGRTFDVHIDGAGQARVEGAGRLRVRTG